MEFLQWCKRYFETEYRPETNYNAVEKRNAAIQTYNASKRVRQRNTPCTGQSSVSATPAANSKRTAMPSAVIAKKTRSSVTASEPSPALQSFQKENLRLKEEVVKVKRIAKTLEKERDFYFSKLQQMDFLFHNSNYNTEDPFIQLLQTIIYSDKEDASTEKKSSQKSAPVTDKENEHYVNVSSSPIM